jgi:signal transduction histidine kinase
MASYLSNCLKWLIAGISRFRAGARYFRFDTTRKDEFGQLADSFDDMAENIVNSVHHPQIITDLKLFVIYANTQVLPLLNKSLDRVLGKPYNEVSLYPYNSPYCPVTALQTTGSHKAKVFYDEKTGKYWQGEANYFVDQSGSQVGYIITSNDVTELQMQQIELEKAKQLAESVSKHKSSFLARMSHELRTPMNAMMGIHSVAQQKISNVGNREEYTELEQYLDSIRNSSKGLLFLLNDILDMSNLETNTVKLVPQPFNMNEILESLAGIFLLNCSAKQLNFTHQFTSFKPADFFADGLRLRQILNNLVNNAIKFTKEGGEVKLSVTQKERTDGKTLVAFSVQDTGIGISKENTEKIFRPFEQADESFSREYSGSGLGLSIVQQLLHLFGSEIHVNSELGKGSEFFFEIWLQEEEKKEKASTEEVVEVDGKFDGQRALVVDDVAINRMVLVSLLKIAGFATDEAKDGIEGVKKFSESKENEYSIVFMDLQMPTMDGFEATLTIRDLDRADAKTVPIVAISANAFHEDIAKSLESGMNSHYAKPIKMDSLSSILWKYCKATTS